MSRASSNGSVLAMFGFVMLIGCGDDGGAGDAGGNADAATDGNGGMVDASTDAPPVDAATATVMAVTCPNTPDASVMAINGAVGTRRFDPDEVTIPVNGVVRFTMTSSHNVIPRMGVTSDPGLTVGFGETKCLQFTVAGTFHYRCAPHAEMIGSVTVQ